MNVSRLHALSLLLIGFCSALGGWVEPVESLEGMVVCGHPEAAAIGADILSAGGNAMDAAVAVGFALGVAEPYGSGIGGKCALLYYSAVDKAVYYVEGLDAAGDNLDVAAFIAVGAAARREGPIGVGVPGMVAVMEKAHGLWGGLDWKTLLEPSILLAEEGFEVLAGTRNLFESRLERIQSNAECARLYLPAGRLPEIGERLANKDLALTMGCIASGGGSAFYRGSVAQRIVRELRAGGSHLTEEDFALYEARLHEPLAIEWGHHEIVSSGRPTNGGPTALLALSLLERAPFPIRESLRDPANLDHWGRVFRHVYPFVQAEMADTPDYSERWTKLAAEDSVEKLLENLRGAEAEGYGNGLESSSEKPDGGWTTHFVVADAEGNVASVTQSLSHHFGSGVVAPGTGVVLNNSLKNFSFSDPSAVNYPAPGKRPRSTIAPALVMREKRPVLAIGLPGGSRIPTTLTLVLADYLYFNRPLGDAISDWRFQLYRSPSKEPLSNTFQFEEGADPTVVAALADGGWDSEVITDAEFFGGITAIELEPGGLMRGWADPRRTNKARAPASKNELLKSK